MQSAILARETEHLFPILGNDWSLWRWVCLRSAGFPVDGVSKLAASSEVITAADEVLLAVQGREQALQKLLQQIHAALDALRSAGEWDDKQKRKPLLNAISKVKAGKLSAHLPSELGPAVEEVQASMLYEAAARGFFHEQFAQSRQETSVAIREIATDARFREALIWQNRTALQTGVNSLLRERPNGASRTSALKQNEEMVASYWQRYCMKNDTIGFFGPVGWALIAPEAGDLVKCPGRELLAVRTTYWEAWAIEALADEITRKYNLQPWIAPFRVPYVRVDGTVLYHPLLGSLRVSAKHAALLQSCNGRDTARQIAARLLRLTQLRFQGSDEIFDGLHELTAKGFIYWKFNIPMAPHAERVLREALQKIDDPEVRRQALDHLEELESAKMEVAQSAGDPDKLDAAFQALEEVFTRLTGVAATRNQGKVYAGRTLVYEDCRRDVEVLLGEEWTKSLMEPLSLLLHTGRWFTARVAEAYKKKFVEVHSAIARMTGNPVVDASLCWGKAVEFFYESASVLMEPVQEEFRAKWERILQLGDDSEPVLFTSEELRPRILAEFPSTRAGWASARYHSPDIMIAAASDEAIRNGNYLFVMGELHVGTNTLQASLFGNQHPSPQDLVNFVERDLGAASVVPVSPKEKGTGSRTVQSLIPKSHFRLEYVPDSFALDRSKALPISSLVLQRQGNELMARTRDGRFRLNVIDLVGGLLSVQVVDCFRIMAPRRHVPRVLIDRLVIKRESWRFPAAELAFAQCPDSAERFLQTRSWARKEGIPRRVFFKVPVERKPAYLDFDSPVLMDLFAKMVRHTQESELPDANVDIAEMLPDHEQAWLTDSDNQRYTSEFRFVAVDRAGLGTP